MTRAKNPQARERKVQHRAKKQRLQTADEGALTRKHMDDLQKYMKANMVLKTDRDDEMALSVCYQQTESRLFSLPFDIRDAIFTYALSQYYDDEGPYPVTASYHRPGNRARLRIDTALLATCRLAWLENHHKSLESAIHTFWFFNGPPGTVDSSRMFMRYFQRMTSINQQNLNRVQIFASNHWAEALDAPQMFDALFDRQVFCPKVLTVTVRHSEWGRLGGNRPLTIEHSWVKQFLDNYSMTRVGRFELELETELDLEDELTTVVQGLKPLRGKAQPVDVAAPDQSGGSKGTQFMRLMQEPPRSCWSKASGMNGEEAHYVVRKIVWVRRPVRLPPPIHLPSRPFSETLAQQRKRMKFMKYLGKQYASFPNADIPTGPAKEQPHVRATKVENEHQESERPKKRRVHRGGRRWIGYEERTWELPPDPMIEAKMLYESFWNQTLLAIEYRAEE